MNDRCQAIYDNNQCRVKKDLTRVQISPVQRMAPSYFLPPSIVVSLCPRHFVLKGKPNGEPK